MMHNNGFSSYEHRSLGEIELPGLKNEFLIFKTAKGCQLKFRDIIALAGDYYGVACRPICKGETEEEQQKRFIEACDDLQNANPEKVDRLIKLIENENKLSDEEKKSFGNNHKSVGETLAALRYTNGNYLLLSENNLDHFNKQAHTAFFAGYSLALKSAYEASQELEECKQQEKLQQAYFFLGFSYHYLTDSFASGHLRVPRVELHTKFGPIVGSLLALIQHNEDGNLGLEVTGINLSQDESKQVQETWFAYGDGHLFDIKNHKNFIKVKQAVEQGVQEIYQVFKSGKESKPSDSLLKKILPKATEKNFPALFVVDEKKGLMCRSFINDSNKNHYTELTFLKALEILIYFAKNCREKYLKARVENAITELRKKLQGECKTIGWMQYLYSFFATPTKHPLINKPENLSVKEELLNNKF